MSGKDEWIFYPHGALAQIAEGLWQVEGRLPRGNLPRNLAVYRMPDGGLLLHSAICLDEEGMGALLRLGEPRAMVVPSAFHRLDAPRYKRRFPALRVLCPAAVRARVEKVVAVDGAIGPGPLPGVPGVVAHAPAGLKPAELAYELALPGGGCALVFTDMLMNLPERLPGPDGLLFRLLGSTGFFGMTRVGRFLLLRDAGALAGWLRAQAEREVHALCVGHGAPVLGREECGARLREAAERLEAVA